MVTAVKKKRSSQFNLFSTRFCHRVTKDPLLVGRTVSQQIDDRTSMTRNSLDIIHVRWTVKPSQSFISQQALDH